MRKIIILFGIAFAIIIAANVVMPDDYRITNDMASSQQCDAVIDNNGYLHVFWQDNRSGNWEIYYERVKIGETPSFGAERKISNGSGDAMNPSIAINGDVIHICWQDNRDGNWEIYYESMTTDGVVICGNYRITNTAGDSINPDISTGNDTVFITWAEENSGEYSIYYNVYRQPSNLPPVANFSYAPMLPDIGETIHFIDNSSDDGEIINYTWDFGDGCVSYERNATHAYSSEGNYNVTLTVTDEYGAQASIKKLVVVGEMIRVCKNYNASTPGWGTDHFSSIQDAIDNASENDTIKVYPGVYESFVIDKPLRIIGDPDVDAHGGIGITLQANNTYIENFTIYNASVGVLIHNDSWTLHNITVYGFHIYECNDYGIEIDDGYDVFINSTQVNDTWGVYVNNSVLTKVANSKLSSNEFGIYLNNSNGSIIMKNNITENSMSGINLDNSSNFNNISENNISFNGANGIRVYHSENNTIFMNRIYNNTEWGIELSFSNNNTVLRNTVSNHTEEWYSAGIVMFYSSSNNNVSLNTVYDNYIDNIEMWDGAENNVVWNNTVWGATYGILMSYEANHNTIARNTIFENEQGIRVGHNASWGGDASNNLFKGNTIHNNTYGIFVNISNNNSFSENRIHDCVYAFYSDEYSINNTIEYMTLASYPITISFIYSNGIAINGTEEPHPSDMIPIGKYLEIYPVTLNSWINLTIHYTDGEVYGVNEYDLALYHWNESTSEWESVETNLDTFFNEINANLTSFSEYGVFATEMNVSIHLFNPWNLITMPVNNTYTASSLGAAIDGCMVITRWDAEKQRYYDYIVGINTPGNPDFDIEDGVAYFVGIRYSTWLNMTGHPIENITITLKPGLNAIGWTGIANTTADDFGSDISNCTYVTKWDETRQEFETYMINAPNHSFVMETGRGVFVHIEGSEDVIWYGGR